MRRRLRGARRMRERGLLVPRIQPYCNDERVRDWLVRHRRGCERLHDVVVRWSLRVRPWGVLRGGEHVGGRVMPHLQRGELLRWQRRSAHALCAHTRLVLPAGDACRWRHALPSRLLLR